MSLVDELAALEDRAARLRAQIAASPCRDVGCDMKFIGGRNAGCGLDGCSCSVPVYACSRCGDSDYGDSKEAAEIIAQCAAGFPSWESLG